MTELAIKSEPLTYRRDSPNSYFRDLLSGGPSARARLDRHAGEMRVEMPKREARAARPAGMEYRTNPNRLQGQGGYGAPPLWLIDEFAGAPRPARVLADMIPQFTLPAGVASVNLPRLTTGARVAVTSDLGAVPSQDIADAAVTSPVVAITGQADIALQILEQSPPGAHFDHIVFTELSADYDAQLETLLFNGTGLNGQFLGVLNVPTGAGLATAVAYTDSTPTSAELLPFVAQAIGKVGDNRLRPPEALFMRTARWAWIAITDMNLAAGPQRLILPVRLADAIPTTVGGSGQDAIVACVPSDMLLLEANAATRVMPQPLSGTLEVRLQLVGYAAALVARQPTGIATVTGTGMTVQSGF